MSSPADRRRRQTVERIAEEALALVAQGGLDALTMSALAKRVDYTAPALYRYFPSKGALIAELNRIVLEGHRARLHARWEGVTDPVERLRINAAELVAHATESPAAFGLVALTLADPRRLVADDLPVHVPELMQLVGDVAGCLTEAQAAGQLSEGPPDERALRWLFGLVGTLQLGKMAWFDARLAPARVTPALADDLLAAWSPGVRP